MTAEQNDSSNSMSNLLQKYRNKNSSVSQSNRQAEQVAHKAYLN